MTVAVEKITQKCPLCGSENPVVLKVEDEKGYSFCKCRSIFFTDWSNIRQETYNPDYVERYRSLAKYYRRYAEEYFNWIRPEGTFLEIGAVTETLLDEAAKRGCRPVGVDIALRDHYYPFLCGDFETMHFENHETAEITTIWAGHVFEHFRDPVGALEKCRDLLVDGGALFVSMPDIWQMPKEVFDWGHWHLHEHHVLWELSQFEKLCHEKGFKTLQARRNPEKKTGYPVYLDFHLLLEKPCRS